MLVTAICRCITIYSTIPVTQTAGAGMRNRGEYVLKCRDCDEVIEGKLYRELVGRKGIGTVCRECYKARVMKWWSASPHDLDEYLDSDPAHCPGCDRALGRRYVHLKKYCCHQCAERQYRRNTRDRTFKPPATCDECLEVFTPKRSDARYCSSGCRVKAHRRKKSVTQ